MSRVCISIGTYNHHVARGDCRKSHVLQDQLLHEAIGRIPKTSLSSIVMLISLKFLRDQLIGRDGEKPLLIFDTEMQEVMYKFESFTNPIIHHHVCKFKKINRNGIIDEVCEL